MRLKSKLVVSQRFQTGIPKSPAWQRSGEFGVNRASTRALSASQKLAELRYFRGGKLKHFFHVKVKEKLIEPLTNFISKIDGASRKMLKNVYR